MIDYTMKMLFNNSDGTCVPSEFGIQNVEKMLSYKVGKGIEDLFGVIFGLPDNEIKITVLDLRLQASSIINFLIENKAIQFVSQGEYYFNKSLQGVEGRPDNMKKFLSNKKSYLYFDTAIGDLGQWYNIQIWYNDGKISKYIKFVDIGKVLIGCDYKELREEFLGLEYKDGSLYTELKRDVETISLCVKELRKYDITEATAAGAAISNFKKSLKEQFNSRKDVFTTLYPDLPMEDVKFCHRAYRGGFCWLNPLYKELCREEPIMSGDGLQGVVIDANSLYPYVMKTYPLPVGMPYKITSEYYFNILFNNEDTSLLKDTDVEKLYIFDFQCSFKLKEGGLPFLQIKPEELKRQLNFENEVVLPTDTQIYTSEGQIVNLTMTSVDLQLFYENYIVEDYSFIEAYVFEAYTGVFEEYVDYWFSKKKEAKETGNKPLYKISKMMLNSLSGKFGAKPITRWKIPVLKDGVLNYEYTGRESNKTVYMPMAAFITSYSRKYMFEKIEQIREIGKEIYGRDVFIYTDTDSIHFLILENLLNYLIEQGFIGGEDIGQFKVENKIFRAKYIRQKTYLLQTVDNSELNTAEEPYKVVCSGLPTEAQEGVNFDNFVENAVFTGKREVYRQVKGGIIKVKEDFKIKGDRVL